MVAFNIFNFNHLFYFSEIKNTFTVRNDWTLLQINGSKSRESYINNYTSTTITSATITPLQFAWMCLCDKQTRTRFHSSNEMMMVLWSNIWFVLKVFREYHLRWKAWNAAAIITDWNWIEWVSILRAWSSKTTTAMKNNSQELALIAAGEQWNIWNTYT